MTQLTLDLFDRIDPMTCPYADQLPCMPGTVLCKHVDGGWYTSCQKSICGEPPKCSLEPPDNVPESVARRLEWIRKNGKDSQDSG